MCFVENAKAIYFNQSNKTKFDSNERWLSLTDKSKEKRARIIIRKKSVFNRFEIDFICSSFEIKRNLINVEWLLNVFECHLWLCSTILEYRTSDRIDQLWIIDEKKTMEKSACISKLFQSTLKVKPVMICRYEFIHSFIRSFMLVQVFFTDLIDEIVQCLSSRTPMSLEKNEFDYLVLSSREITVLSIGLFILIFQR